MDTDNDTRKEVIKLLTWQELLKERLNLIEQNLDKRLDKIERKIDLMMLSYPEVKVHRWLLGIVLVAIIGLAIRVLI